MSPKTIIRMARPFRSVIGKHAELIGTPNLDTDTYAQARRDSDEAVSTAKYLIQHLSNRHDAVLFARALGMPGYINFR